MQSEREDKRARLDLQRRELLLKEFKMGLITKEEYRSEVTAFELRKNLPVL